MHPISTHDQTTGMQMYFHAYMARQVVFSRPVYLFSQESVDGDTEEMRLHIVFKSSHPECNWTPDITYELVMQRNNQVHMFMLLLSALYTPKSRLKFCYSYNAFDKDGCGLWSSPFSEM